MPTSLLKVENLSASIEGRRLLDNVSLTINPGEVHVLMGPNGAGKSTLANVIMGDPRYQLESGKIFFDGEDITQVKTDVRARKGIFLSFQAPEEIAGVSVENFLRAAKAARTGETIRLVPFRKELQAKMAELEIAPEYASRYLNVGFSGGEKKKSEILQMEILKPRLVILDETDSGLDIDAVKTISESLGRYKNSENGILIITHITRILQSLPVDYVHILSQGHIVKTADASVIEQINQHGFASMLA